MNLADLVAAKRARRTLDLGVPARRATKPPTIGAIVHEVRTALVGRRARRRDRRDRRRLAPTRPPTVARAAGATVVAEADVLPEAGPGSGKGNALWKSLQACAGDLAVLARRRPPQLPRRHRRPSSSSRSSLDADIVLVKASYTRSFEGAPTGGGRVTELVARPLLSLLFPKLADIVQPLGGEYAARRDALEVLPFVEGWGVELGLLVDVVERFGRDAVAQVDLGTREHRNRPVDELAAQSLAIIATALRRAGLMQFDGPTLELAPRRPRRQRRRRARRDPRTPPDRDDPRLPRRALLDSNRREHARSMSRTAHAGSTSRAARPASTAASSTRSAARG